MALSFIGKPISLISHSDVRYRGILAGIDPAASTIQLSNVFSMGTESRRPPEQFIPPVQEPYSYIIFRASEVKDLAVDEPAPRRSVHDDPAVLGASAPIAPGSYPFNNVPQPSQPQSQAQPQQQQQRQAYPPRQPAVQPVTAQQAPAPVQNGAAPAPTGNNKNVRNNAVTSATASLESVERALGDLRVATASGHDVNAAPNGGAPRGGRRGHGRHQDYKIPVPATDFDFQSSNAKFDKAALGPRTPPKVDGALDAGEDEESAGDDAEKKGKDKAEREPVAYNPKNSFFDSLSSGSNGPSADNRGGRGGRRGGGGRNRREEERERNVATFGEPGGIGLMGPGAYVGGWGGHGRRGGGRGRRGGIAANAGGR